MKSPVSDFGPKLPSGRMGEGVGPHTGSEDQGPLPPQGPHLPETDPPRPRDGGRVSDGDSGLGSLDSDVWSGVGPGSGVVLVGQVGGPPPPVLLVPPVFILYTR